jgi:hypothetical protein
MTTFCETTNIKTGEKRYYVGGCRTTKQVFETVGDGKRDCFLTKVTDTHIRQYHCRRL